MYKYTINILIKLKIASKLEMCDIKLEQFLFKKRWHKKRYAEVDGIYGETYGYREHFTKQTKGHVLLFNRQTE